MSGGCRGALLFCIDYRFHESLRALITELGLDEGGTDVIRVAGSARGIARPEHPRDRDFILDQLRKAHALHGVRHFFLVNHEDCRAYGELDVPDSKEELALHHRDLREARAIVLDAFDDVQVEVRFIRSTGVAEVVAC